MPVASLHVSHEELMTVTSACFTLRIGDSSLCMFHRRKSCQSPSHVTQEELMTVASLHVSQEKLMPVASLHVSPEELMTVASAYFTGRIDDSGLCMFHRRI